jgi:hypothetical protein
MIDSMDLAKEQEDRLETHPPEYYPVRMTWKNRYHTINYGMSPDEFTRLMQLERERSKSRGRR